MVMQVTTGMLVNMIQLFAPSAMFQQHPMYKGFFDIHMLMQNENQKNLVLWINKGPLAYSLCGSCSDVYQVSMTLSIGGSLKWAHPKC
ncbi:hypothetical protein ACJX0J_027697, partial [Zea mays]